MDIKNLIVKSIADNKKLIIGLYVFFIIVFIASWFISASKIGTVPANMTTISNPGGGTNPLDLFINNEMSGIQSYIGSIFFGIGAIVTIAINGFNNGMLGPIFAHAVPNGGVLYILYLIPHGIFEFTAMIFESTGGILLFLFIWNFIKTLRSNETNGASEAFEKNKKLLIQSIVLFVIATLFTLIAAPIEAYVSINFSEFLMKLFGLM